MKFKSTLKGSYPVTNGDLLMECKSGSTYENKSVPCTMLTE